MPASSQLSSLSRLAALAALCAASAVLAQEGDLADFRSVETALKAQIAPAATARVRRPGYLGISTAPDAKGRLQVEDVELDSPAARAGLQAGDLLQRLDGRELRSAEALREALQAKSPGDSVQMRLQRGRKKLEVTTVLGATTRPMRASGRAVMGIQTAEPREMGGVPVRAVTGGMPAEKAGLKSGDVILKIDGTQVGQTVALTDLLATRDPGDTVIVTVQREGQESEIKVQLTEDPAAQNTPGAGRNLWKNDVYRLAVIGVEYRTSSTTTRSLRPTGTRASSAAAPTYTRTASRASQSTAA